jgi:hypothetical protein
MANGVDRNRYADGISWGAEASHDGQSCGVMRLGVGRERARCGKLQHRMSVE